MLELIAGDEEARELEQHSFDEAVARFASNERPCGTMHSWTLNEYDSEGQLFRRAYGAGGGVPDKPGAHPDVLVETFATTRNVPQKAD